MHLFDKFKLPSQIILFGTFLSLATSLVTAIFVENISEIDVGIRSYPENKNINEYFTNIISLLKTVSIYILLFSTIIFLSILLLQCNKKFKIDKINKNIINSFSSDSNPSLQFVFIIFCTLLLSSICLPIIGYLLTSPWQILKDIPLISSADKRWLIFGYNAFWFSFLVVPIFIKYLLENIYSGSRIALTTSPTSCAERNLTSRKLPGRPAYFYILPVFLAWLAWGPPWNIDLLTIPINSHLMESMASYQAIDSGYLPYTGPAASGYGPGSQLLLYYYQKAQGGLGIDNLKEGFAFINWIAVTIYFVAIYYLLGVRWGFIIALLSSVISPFALYTWLPSGAITGLFGWSNAFRYIALPIVTLGIVHIIFFGKRTSPHWSLQAFSLGLFWGAMAYVSQENATLPLIATVALLLISLAGRVITVKQLVTISSSLLAGAGLVFGVILSVYLFHGSAKEFLLNYNHIPRYVLQGTTCAYWSGGIYANYFYWMPIIAILFSIACMLRFTPLGFIKSFDYLRLSAIAASISFLVANMSSIIRSDDIHVMNGMIATPLLIILIYKYIYVIYGKRTFLLLFFIITIVMFYIFPVNNLLTKFQQYTGRLNSLLVAQIDRPRVNLTTYRIPQAIVEMDECCQYPTGLSGKDLLNIIENIQYAVGRRKVIVDSLPKLDQPAFITLLGDLVPAPVFEDINTRYPTYASRLHYFSEASMQLDNVGAIVTKNLTRPLAKAMLQLYPHAQVLEFKVQNEKYYVIRHPFSENSEINEIR